MDNFKCLKTKGLTLAQALPYAVPLRRFNPFKKHSLLTQDSFILEKYGEQIQQYSLAKEDLLASDWELSPLIFKHFLIQTQNHHQGPFLYIAKETRNLSEGETLRVVEKKPGYSILSYLDLEAAFRPLSLLRSKIIIICLKLIIPSPKLWPRISLFVGI
jgi:hypothetical protein